MALKMINVKLDPRMHEALKRLADREFTTISSLVKKGIDQLLRQHSIEWRQETNTKPKKP